MSIVERALQKAQSQAKSSLPPAPVVPPESAPVASAGPITPLHRLRLAKGHRTTTLTDVARFEGYRAARYPAAERGGSPATANMAQQTEEEIPPHQVAAAECDRRPRRGHPGAEQRDPGDQCVAERGQVVYLAQSGPQRRARPRDAGDPRGWRRGAPRPDTDVGPGGSPRP